MDNSRLPDPDTQSGLSRDGGIGRRTGLKIQRGQLHGGSIPPPGTKLIQMRVNVSEWRSVNGLGTSSVINVY